MVYILYRPVTGELAKDAYLGDDETIPPQPVRTFTLMRRCGRRDTGVIEVLRSIFHVFVEPAHHFIDQLFV
jgi:hypothetical protein